MAFRLVSHAQAFFPVILLTWACSGQDKIGETRLHPIVEAIHSLVRWLAGGDCCLQARLQTQNSCTLLAGMVMESPGMNLTLQSSLYV